MNNEISKRTSILNRKLPKKTHVHVHPKRFEQWIIEIMKEPEMKYSSPADVAERITEKHGGLKRSHLSRIYRMRLKMSDYWGEDNDDHSISI